MVRELISLLRADPTAKVDKRFALMLTRAHEMVLAAGRVLFDKQSDGARREQIYQWDHEVNELEQEIRRWVLVHLAFPSVHPDLARSLSLISLAKDVERLGDYAKNLAEIVDIRSGPFPEGQILSELTEIRGHAELLLQACVGVFSDSQSDEAEVAQLIRTARPTVRRCDELIRTIVRSDHGAAVASAFTLATRHYKRITAHVLNVLSSIVMPLDKVDYYDEETAMTRRPDSRLPDRWSRSA